jgi:hypothetical protein
MSIACLAMPVHRLMKSASWLADQAQIRNPFTGRTDMHYNEIRFPVDELVANPELI